MIDRGIVHDAQQPAPKRRILAKLIEPVKRTQKRVLRHIVGVGRSHDPPSDPNGHAAVAIDEFLECAQLALTRGTDQRGVAVGRGSRSLSR